MRARPPDHKPAAAAHQAACFPPVATRQSRALILGSMPGLKSLSAQQYYAHPQNAFWKIMALLFDAPVDTYRQRLDIIRTRRLALWDVLADCARVGSLDAAIDSKSISVNDFSAFLRRYSAITHIFFNGGKAEQEFRRRVLPALPEKIAARLTLTRLPSTSPAMAKLRPAAKAKAWQAVRDCVD